MLASTVQFSNNDQYTVTHHYVMLHRRRQLKAASRPCPQTPNNVPGTLPAPLDVPRSCEQYQKEKTIKCAE